MLCERSSDAFIHFFFFGFVSESSVLIFGVTFGFSFLSASLVYDLSFILYLLLVSSPITKLFSFTVMLAKSRFITFLTGSEILNAFNCRVMAANLGSRPEGAFFLRLKTFFDGPPKDPLALVLFSSAGKRVLFEIRTTSFACPFWLLST